MMNEIKRELELLDAEIKEEELIVTSKRMKLSKTIERFDHEWVEAIVEEFGGGANIVMNFPDLEDMSDCDSEWEDDIENDTPPKLNKKLLSSPQEMRENQSEDNAQETNSNIEWCEESLKNNLIKEFVKKSNSDELTAAKTPVDFFELFFSDSLIYLLVEQTNLNGMQKGVNLHVSMEEMRIVIALMLYSCTTPVATKKFFWSFTEVAPAVLIKSISKDRFNIIIKYLHIVNNDAEYTNRDYKFKSLFDHLQGAFIKHGSLEQNMTVGQNLVPYFSKRVYKCNPSRFGYRLWTMCSTGGYLHAFELDTSDEGSNCQETTDSAILNLLKKANVPSNKGCVIHLEKHLTSFSLLKKLSAEGIFASGFCFPDKTANCPIVSSECSQNDPRNGFKHLTANNVMILYWNKIRPIIFATNFDIPTEVINIMSKEEKASISNECSKCVLYHQKHSNYCLEFERNIRDLSIMMKESRWWWPMFTYMLSASLNNAMVLMKKINKEITEYEFIFSIANHYCRSYGKPTMLKRQEKRYDQKSHWIKPLDPPSNCALCQVKSEYQCEKCGTCLHADCFKEYHTKK